MNQQKALICSNKYTHLYTAKHTCKIISVTTIINIHIYALFIFEIDFECHIATAASFHFWTFCYCFGATTNKTLVQIISHHFTFWHTFAKISTNLLQSIQHDYVCTLQFKCLIFICQRMSFNLSHWYTVKCSKHFNLVNDRRFLIFIFIIIFFFLFYFI